MKLLASDWLADTWEEDDAGRRDILPTPRGCGRCAGKNILKIKMSRLRAVAQSEVGISDMDGF